MIFVKHSELVGKHCLFSPSKPGWINYSVPKMFERIDSEAAKMTGTLIHEFAASQIYLRHKVKSKRVLVEGIENYIYNKYFDEKYNELSYTATEYIKKVGPIVDRIYDTLKDYINDGIGFKMLTEWGLKYSDNFFGHADSIIFRDKTLRIHDLKTGTTPAKMEQLLIYAALFCLEYNFKPAEIDITLGVYKKDEVAFCDPESEEIIHIMNRIVHLDKLLRKMDNEEV